MAEKIYEEVRPTIPAELRRKVNVEAGHECSVKGCSEHTYLEIHHINQNREDNRLENLILLCDKHHKMAHANIIDRKALKEYKLLLQESHNQEIMNRFESLEKLITEKISEKSHLIEEMTKEKDIDDKLKKISPDRNDILRFVLTQVTISHYENQSKLYFERQVEFIKGQDRLLLDALRQDDYLESDIIMEFHHFRKAYIDAPVYGSWLEKKLELYELLTGRKAKGILLIAAKEGYGSKEDWPLTLKGIDEVSSPDNIEMVVYTYGDIGFKPGAVSATMFTSNLKTKDN